MPLQANKKNEIATPLDFSRFEFKYLIADDKRKEFERELGHFVEFDPFVEQTERHRYFVRSLYYDDPHYSAFFDKVDGLKKRSKFRLRTYSSDSNDNAPQFLEIKGRHNQLVYKHRTPVQVPGDKDPTQVLLLDPQDDRVRRQFIFDYYKKQLQPAALIDYWRRPYISKWDPEFRLTFDMDLQVSHTNKLFPGLHDTSRKVLPGYTVMEVKFRRHNPAWFHRLLRAYELERVSVSKICYGLQALGIVEDI